jgi:hypothetical protein
LSDGSGLERTGPARAGGAWLGLWTVAGHALSPLAEPLLRRRLARGKEDPARWREKLGEPTAARPQGRLAWLHAVGLGEVLALRGLIAEMADRAPDLSFLVTSTARSAALATARNLPPRTIHQFLPLDLRDPAGGSSTTGARTCRSGPSRTSGPVSSARRRPAASRSRSSTRG